MPSTTVQLSEDALSRIVNAIKGDSEAVSRIAGAVRPSEPPPLTPLIEQQLAEIFANEKTAQALQEMFDSGKVKLPTRRKVKPKATEASDQADMGQDLEDTDEADMEQNAIADAVRSLDNVGGRNMDIPWGSALLGGFLGVTATEIIDGFSPPAAQGSPINFTNLALKIGVAWGAAEFLPQYTGRNAALISSALVVFSAVRDVTPLNDWIARVVAWFRGLGNGGGTQSNRFANYSYSYQNRFEQPYRYEPLSAGEGHTSFHQSLPGYSGAGRDEIDSVFRPY